MGAEARITRTGRKFDQVVEGARKVFLAEGFEGASVDDIARAAGVSKATLYSYFPDKRLLFLEVARCECARMAEGALSLIDEDDSPREVLTKAGSMMVPFLLGRMAQSIFRLCLAESERFPELGRTFFANGPQMGHDRLAEYLSAAVARGELQIDDIDLAADQFTELCKARLWTRRIFGIQTEFSRQEIDEVIEAAVEMFLARYGTDQSSRRTSS